MIDPINIITKLEILQRIRNGESIRELSKIYKLSRSSVFLIGKNGHHIENYRASLNFTDDELKEHVKLMSSKKKNFEEALYSWFVQCWSLGVPIDVRFLREKALQLNAEMEVRPDFKASYGRLISFIKRHKIPGMKTNRSK